MTSAQKLEIIMSILAYTRGRWTPDECYEFLYLLMEECEEKTADIKVITGGTTAH